MAKRGRKPIPLALRIARGLEDKDTNYAEPFVPPGDPIPPDTLDEIGLKEWKRILPTIKAMGILTLADGDALALYCRAYSRWKQALSNLDDEGMTIIGPRLGLIENPSLRIAERAEDAMRRILLEFGLTPASRQRVKPTTVKKDDLAAFLDRAETMKAKRKIK
jgi:P27 family predicted phage terminase small subunit